MTGRSARGGSDRQARCSDTVPRMPTLSLNRSSLALSLLPTLLLVACSPDDQLPPDEVMDAGTDTTPTARCEQVKPRLGDSAQAQALAAAPARCGQAAHAWLSSAHLGDITEMSGRDQVPAASSAVLLAVGKITPKGPLHDVDVEQIAYLTQDRGRLLPATALIAYPTDLKAAAALDVLLVLHGTSGFMDQCAPSRDSSTRGLIAALASMGRVVVAPDYIGLRALGAPTGFLHPYLAGQPTAMASLDAVRAAAKHLARNRSESAVACAGTRFATVGGSQGGHAALWVDRLAPYYAPELQHLGVVATVPPSDLVGQATRALRSLVPASANMAAFYAATSDWYGTRDKLGEVFVPPLEKDLPAALAASCDPGEQLKGKALNAVFTKALLDAAAKPEGLSAVPTFGCLAVENGLTTTTLRRPAQAAPGYGVLFVLGESDTLVDPGVERAAFDTLCGQGMKMQYLECAGASHTKATTWAMPEIVDFLEDRYADKAPSTASLCQRGAAVKCRATP